MNSIDAIIFDFGGVIIDIDYNKPAEIFRNIGVKGFEKLFSQAAQSGIFDQLDKGTVPEQDFRNYIKSLTTFPLSDAQIDEAWNSILIGIPEEKIRLLEQLKEQYRIFLLSNSNSIHYPVYLKELQERFGYSSFDELFEKAYFSFQIGMRKPDAEIFQLVLNNHNLNPKNTLFIDDSMQHIESAEKLGLQCCHLKQSNQLEKCIREKLCIF